MTSYTEYHKRYYEKQKGTTDTNRAVAIKLINNARYRATQRGLDFDLTVEDIVIPDKCPYLDLHFSEMFGKNKEIRGDFLPTLDRIDNTKGYVKGNVEVISRLANTMKNKATKEQLICFATHVLETYR